MMDLVYVMDHRHWTLFKEFELVHLLINYWNWIGPSLSVEKPMAQAQAQVQAH